MKHLKHSDISEATAKPTKKVDGPTKNSRLTHKQDTDACIDNRSWQANQSSVKDKICENFAAHSYMDKIISSSKREGLPDNGYEVDEKPSSSAAADGRLHVYEYCYIQSNTVTPSSGCREGARQGVYEAVGDLRF
ncbi:uncharacterized protein LOC121412251 [Lytechinus variegatus]|uniref:uncharacterized protein LOC121412251 n=1 Tax=Lytechinus variegatus TaxID=7654 RepID=UPI001BB20DB7|nr:uncharacterized protein LOC121412251 [Lytechinus variegatus]